MTDEPPRVYVPSPKHKFPKGHGSLCPSELPRERAQLLLDAAIAVPEVRAKALWAVDGSWCFMAYPTHPNDAERPEWHGFPVIGVDVDERVLRALENRGRISRAQRRRLCKQRDLPKMWPA